MGREVRNVPADWKHPKNASGFFVPLFDGWAKRCADKAAWEDGSHPNRPMFRDLTWEEFAGDRKPEQYMPDWPEDQRTHFQLYETTTEGTPVSPVFATMEALIDYAAEHCTVFADMKTSREEWGRMLGAGFVAARVGNMLFI